MLFKLLLFVAPLVADLLTVHFAALVAALVADETISIATPFVPDSHHTWVGNEDVKIDKKNPKHPSNPSSRSRACIAKANTRLSVPTIVTAGT